eukprot:354399-Chlamydomonas_euryale.AAC.7
MRRCASTAPAAVAAAAARSATGFKLPAALRTLPKRCAATTRTVTYAITHAWTAPHRRRRSLAQLKSSADRYCRRDAGGTAPGPSRSAEEAAEWQGWQRRRPLRSGPPAAGWQGAVVDAGGGHMYRGDGACRVVGLSWSDCGEESGAAGRERLLVVLPNRDLWQPGTRASDGVAAWMRRAAWDQGF